MFLSDGLSALFRSLFNATELPPRRLLASLGHKNVMRLIEVFHNEEKGKIYIVLEYCCAVLKVPMMHLMHYTD